KNVLLSVALLPTASRAVTANTWLPVGVGTCVLLAVPAACATWVPSIATVYRATPLTLSVAAGQVSVPGSVPGSVPTASARAGAVSVAAFAPGGTGPAAGATNDTAVAWLVLPAPSLALTTTLCVVPADSAGSAKVVVAGSTRPTTLPSRVTV